MSAPATPWMRRLPRRPAAAPEAHLTRRIDLVNRARAGTPPAAPAGPSRIDLVHPARTGAPSPLPAPAPAPAPTSRIDLVNRARTTPPAPAPTSRIDLVNRARTGTPAAGPGSAPSRSAAPAGAVPSSGLTSLAPSVSGTREPAPPPPTRGAALLLQPPPGVTGIVTLDPEDPVVRLDALQSGIGALTVRGAERVAWEDMGERSGVVELTGPSTGDDVPRHGNRSLLRPLDGEVVVTLRHVRRLRRLLVDAPADSAVGLAPWCDGVVRAADPEARLRISVVVVEGRLEIRAEYGLPEPWREALTAMGWSPLASVPRSTPDVWA